MSTQLAVLGGKPTRSKSFPAWPQFGKEEQEQLCNVVTSGLWGIGGSQIKKFEDSFSSICDGSECIAVTNGTVSLRLALMALGIQAGDEVIVPPYTFLATATSVIEANAVPVFVDIDPVTYNMSPAAIENAITPRTRAIIPVHFGGLMADMDQICKVAKKHGLAVIEDAAHAHGASYKGKKAGSIGSLGSFSFQSTKNLTSGEGGLITTKDSKLADTCRSLRNCGRLATGAWYEHHIIAGNYRLSEFQAAVLNCQVKRLQDQFKTREINAEYLTSNLTRLPGISVQSYDKSIQSHAYHLYMLRYNADEFGTSRENVSKALNAEGIPVSTGYPLPLYRQPLFLNKAFGPYTGYLQSNPSLDYSKVSCPATEKACSREALWMTQNLLLGSKQDMQDIVDAFEKVYANRASLK